MAGGDPAEQIAKLALSNVQSGAYWSGTEYAPSADLAWSFYTFIGVQGRSEVGLGCVPCLLRPGDVAAAVPEPQTLALALLALGAAVVARGRRPA